MLRYSADNWYWVDAKGKIYSSKHGGLITTPAHDTDYQVFLSAAGRPTPMRSDDFLAGSASNLDEVLKDAGQPQTGFTLDNTKAAVINEATKACEALQAQMTSSSVHRMAMQSAAVLGIGGAPAATTLFGAKFAALADKHGVNVADFATLATVMTGASLDISNALMALENAVDSATSRGALASALDDFEKALGAIAADINAAKPISAVSPAQVLVKGVNA